MKEITVPKTLRGIGARAFDDLDNATIYVEDGCKFLFSAALIPASVRIGPVLTQMALGVRVWDMRGLRDVVIPDGVEAIGNHWFYGSGIVSASIPGSVVEIGTQAFCNCRMLERLEFRERGKPEMADDVENFALGRQRYPVSEFDEQDRLKIIGREAFCRCSNLRKVDLPDSVDEIGLDAFADSGLESFTAPKSLRIIR